MSLFSPPQKKRVLFGRMCRALAKLFSFLSFEKVKLQRRAALMTSASNICGVMRETPRKAAEKTVFSFLKKKKHKRAEKHKVQIVSVTDYHVDALRFRVKVPFDS